MWQTKLPSGTNMTVVATIRDTLGSATSFRIPPLNVSTLTIAELLPLIQNAQSVLDASHSVNASVFRNAILIAAEAAFGSAASHLKNEILRLLDSATQSQATVDGAVASTIAAMLQRLSANLTSSQSSTVLSVAATVSNRTSSISQQTGDAMLAVLESTLAGEFACCL